MLLVEIEKPTNEGLSAWLFELRQWLDANHCAPSTVTPAGRRIDRLIYRVSFDRAAQAHRFAAQFRRYSPSIRRANAFERGQLRMAGGMPSWRGVATAGAAD